jgi:hypothetical protein
MKVFKFTERIPATIVQHYEVIAETEEEALAMVQDGSGFQNATTVADGAGDIELYDTEELPELWQLPNQGIGLDNLNRRLS